jgi:hypothetical protein
VTGHAPAGLPAPAAEIKMIAVNALRGFNYWSRRPVICMDLVVGAFEHISSADVPGVTESLLATMPGLMEHECSVGAHGGFITRLKRGTYAPHIVEHVALELQTMIGHEMSYGRTRGGDAEGSYTLAFEYRHEQVGLRAASLALDAVQRAFAGTLVTVRPSVQELRALARTPDSPAIRQAVFCGIVGNGARAETQHELAQRLELLGQTGQLIIDVSPAYLLRAGLPYFRSEMAIILDVQPTDVPFRYQEPDRAQRLVSVLADAVRIGGFVICPANAPSLQHYLLEQGLRIAVFSTDDEIAPLDQQRAVATVCVRDGHIQIAHRNDVQDAGPLGRDTPAIAQVVAALAEHVLRHS